MNSGLKVLPKGLRCSILSKITARMLTFRDQVPAFSLRGFIVFHCFKCYLASFFRYKTVFLPNIKHAEQDQIDAKWLGKKLVF